MAEEPKAAKDVASDAASSNEPTKSKAEVKAERRAKQVATVNPLFIATDIIRIFQDFFDDCGCRMLRGWLKVKNKKQARLKEVLMVRK